MRFGVIGVIGLVSVEVLDIMLPCKSLKTLAILFMDLDLLEGCPC
jgi:hypothetical protein